MRARDVERVADRLRRRYDDACFACGRSNPIGLHLDGFSLKDGQVTAWFEPRPEYRGVENSLHGGVVATALDEILVWASVLTHGVVALTATLNLRYRRPTRPQGRYKLQGRVDERRGRRLVLSGELLDGSSVAVSAQGLYLADEDVSHLLAEG